MKLITTGDGSHTLFVPELNEHYHSVNGAIRESEHIFIKNGFLTCETNPVRIFEAGFGTGLNALLTLLRNEGSGKIVHYTAFEKYPLPVNVLSSLNYSSLSGDPGRKFFNAIHSSGWDKAYSITDTFFLEKINADLTKDKIPGEYDLIYFDAFGPDKQPEMWTMEIFEKIASITAVNGIFVTYSAKGEVKRNLRHFGFRVELLAGPPGKRQIIRAVKC